MTSTAIYYEDQRDWKPDDFQHLFRYLNKIFQSIGPNEAQRKDPSSRSALIAAKRFGRHDQEIAAIDLRLCSAQTLHLMKAVLLTQGRLAIATRRFPNLRRLALDPEVIDKRKPILLSSNPSLIDRRLTDVAIHI